MLPTRITISYQCTCDIGHALVLLLLTTRIPAIRMQQPTSDVVFILGTGVNIFPTYDDVIELIHQRIRSGAQTFCVAVNPEKLYKAARNPKLQNALRSADIRVCDGIGISLASILLYRRPIPRCTGIDLFLRLIRLSAEKGLRIFVLGASPEVNEAGCLALIKAHPGLKIVGRHHGYVEDFDPIIHSINQSGAELLFVAMGSPRQEFWISENRRRLSPPFCMGIGGSLDVMSGRVRRAPTVFRVIGAEWLYRLISEPSRFRRQVVLPVFAMDVLQSMADQKRGQQ